MTLAAITPKMTAISGFEWCAIRESESAVRRRAPAGTSTRRLVFVEFVRKFGH